jgi:hypothetical protein
MANKSLVSFIFVVLFFPLETFLSISLKFINWSLLILALRPSPLVILPTFVLISTSSVLIFRPTLIVSTSTSRWT